MRKTRNVRKHSNFRRLEQQENKLSEMTEVFLSLLKERLFTEGDKIKCTFQDAGMSLSISGDDIKKNIQCLSVCSYVVCKVRVYHRLELSMGLEQPSIDRSRKWKEKEAVLRCGLLWLEGTGFLAFIYDKAADKSGTKPAFGDVD